MNAMPVIRHALRITLLEDCVFSAGNATVGGHRSVDRIPGQTLLGAAASRLYRRFLDAGGTRAYTAFHSGRLRFLDGLPCADDEIAHPVPLAWHEAKTPASGDSTVYNFAAPGSNGEIPGGKQPKQIREGYVFADGRRLLPMRNLRMKTAIDPRTGRADEGKLFGYESLVQGRSLIAWVEADADCDDLLKEVAAVLHGEILLGRSRSAEYGRVHVEFAPAATPIKQGSTGSSTHLTLWLLSDLALTDDTGRPTLEPSARALGLPGAKILWSKTFLRHRRYSPWNQARHGYDRERLLLAAGGVITLQLETPLTQEQHDRLATGIGLYREAGLGRVWMNPPFLQQETLSPPNGLSPSPRVSDAVADHRLLSWLRMQSEDWKTDLDQTAGEYSREFGEQLRVARRLGGVSQQEDFGPSKSQWGRVYETARSRSGQTLFEALFEGDQAVIKQQGEGWSETIRYTEEGAPYRLRDWLRDRLAWDGAMPAEHYAYLVRHLAHRLRQDTRRQGVRTHD